MAATRVYFQFLLRKDGIAHVRLAAVHGGCEEGAREANELLPRHEEPVISKICRDFFGIKDALRERDVLGPAAEQPPLAGCVRRVEFQPRAVAARIIIIARLHIDAERDAAAKAQEEVRVRTHVIVPGGGQNGGETEGIDGRALEEGCRTGCRTNFHLNLNSMCVRIEWRLGGWMEE